MNTQQPFVPKWYYLSIHPELHRGPVEGVLRLVLALLVVGRDRLGATDVQLAAGMAEVKYRRFLVWNPIGGFVRAVSMAIAGAMVACGMVAAIGGGRPVCGGGHELRPAWPSWWIGGDPVRIGVMDVSADSLPHAGEQHTPGTGQKLNWLRAGVLGANDGVVSTAGVVIGVAGATPHNLAAIATAGIAALVAGAFSMAGGEYVSVSTQRDTEKALIAKEKWELKNLPVEEHEELAGLYRQRGLSERLAHQVAEELMAKDALAAHAEMELGIDPDNYTSPWAAAGSSFVAFTVGALIPLIVILLPLGGYRIWMTAAAVVVGLLLTGWISATLGQAPRGRAVIRNVFMGGATMVATYLIGMVFGTAVS